VFNQKINTDHSFAADNIFGWVNGFITASVVVDRKGNVIFVSNSFVRFSGIHASALLNRGFASLFINSEYEPGKAAFDRNCDFIGLLMGESNNEIPCRVKGENLVLENGSEYSLYHFMPVHIEGEGDAAGSLTAEHDNLIKADTLAGITHRYSAILDSIPDLLVLFDSNAKVIDIHQNPDSPFFYLGTLLRTSNLSDLFPGKAAQILHNIASVDKPAANKTFYDEIEFSGKHFSLEYRLVFVETNRVLALIRDISSLKKTEKELLMSRERLSHIQQIAGIGSWDAQFDNLHEIHTWNFFELLGLDNPGSKAGIDDLYHYNSIHPDDLARYKKTIAAEFKSLSGFYTIEYRIKCPDKKVKFLQADSKVEYNEAGKPRRWTGVIQDITVRKRAEILTSAAFEISQLIHSQNTIEDLIEAVHHIIGKLMPADNLLIALRDEKTNELTFPYFSGLKLAPDPARELKGLTGFVVSTGVPLLVSASAIDLMVSEKIIGPPVIIPDSWLGVPLRSQDTVTGVLALQSFSPEIVYAEDDQHILMFVSEQIALSIQRIENDAELLKAKNEAEDSSRLKSSLLANMSHELRTPMTGILGFSEILLEELEDERLKTMANTIYKSANRLMSTLNSIMDLSAIESNTDALHIKPVNIKSTFLPLLRQLYPVASDKGLYLRTALSPSLYVQADEKLLGQLLQHLLDNAIKFTVDGGIAVSAFVNDQNKSETIIRVSDTGIGIAPEHLNLIFEEFRQVSEGLSRTFEGSGLGLSLCIKIARLIKARLWVESVPDKGSDFYVALPTAVAMASEPVIDPEAEVTINTRRLSRGTVPEVLIVEDNEINRRLAALYLRELCTIEMAENGYIALEKIKRKEYDAILLDINLGAGPNGLSIASQVRALENYQSTPIVAVTGYTMQGDREKLLANGCTHYLAKPYDKKTLLRLFTSILYT